MARSRASAKGRRGGGPTGGEDVGGWTAIGVTRDLVRLGKTGFARSSRRLWLVLRQSRLSVCKGFLR